MAATYFEGGKDRHAGGKGYLKDPGGHGKARDN
jgi:hypothetical protein